MAARKGYLRPASDADLKKWFVMNQGKQDNHDFRQRLKHFDKYVVTQPLRFSGGLGGAKSVILVVNDRRNIPVGDIGHSTILYSYSGACKGPHCG